MARLVRAIRFALTHRCAATHRRVSVWEEETMKADVELLIPHFTFAGDVYPGGPVEVATFPFKDRMESAARAGFKGVGLQHADVMWNAERLGLKEMRRILEANGLKYLELEFLVDWFADGDKRRASDAMRAEMLTICAELGVRNIKAGADFSTPHADVLRMAEAFAGLCRDTARSGSEATLEIMPFSNVRTLETGLAIVSAADQPNGGLLLDIWHMGRGNIPYSDINKIPARFIRAAEIDDAPRVPVESDMWQETIHHRVLCGEGDLNVPSFVREIRKAGYKGPFGVEVLSAELRRLPLDQMTQRVFDSAMAQFAAV
jgi:sugar phosphate isomerase/epimerase